MHNPISMDGQKCNKCDKGIFKLTIATEKLGGKNLLIWINKCDNCSNEAYPPEMIKSIENYKAQYNL